MSADIVSRLQRATSLPPADKMTALEKGAEVNAAPTKDSMFQNCYLLVRDANQAKPDVVVPLNSDVLLTMLKLCLDNCLAPRVVEQPSISKDSGFADMLTSMSVSSKQQTSVADWQCGSAEKECAETQDRDVLDWSIASNECTHQVELPTTERQIAADDTASVAEHSLLSCVSSTPRRGTAEAGFDRFWRSMSPAVNNRLEAVDEDLMSLASPATCDSVQTDATLDSLDDLADEPQEVLCSEFSWLFKNKNVRDTLLSIGATQKVLYEIMVRNRYHQECDQREQRMIVDTYDVRRAVERARCVRDAPLQVPYAPHAGRYEFSDCEEDYETEEELEVLPARRVRKPRNRPVKRQRLAQSPQPVFLSPRCFTSVPEPETPVETAPEIAETSYVETSSGSLPQRGAKVAAKLAITAMFSINHRSRKNKGPRLATHKRAVSARHVRRWSRSAEKTPESLDQSIVLRSRKRSRSLITQ